MNIGNEACSKRYEFDARQRANMHNFFDGTFARQDQTRRGMP